MSFRLLFAEHPVGVGLALSHKISTILFTLWRMKPVLSKAETCARTHSTRAGAHAQLCMALTTKPAERSEVRLQGRPL